MTRAWRNKTVGAILAMAGMLAAPVAAQQATSAPGAQAQQIERYVVGEARPPVIEGRQMIDLTLEQATQIAIEKNLDLKVARMNPQSVDYQLVAARASFMPQITSSYSFNNSQSPSENTLDGVKNVSNKTQGFNGGFSQTLPWHAGSFSANFNNSRSSTNRLTSPLNPSYSSSVRLSYSMPLMAGFKIDNTRNQLRTLQITRQISDITLLAAIENTKNSVRQSYWSLRSAIEQIEIARRALELARRSYDDSRIKIEIGTLAPIEITNFETQVANAEQQVLAAEIGWRTAELNFKRLLVSGADDELYAQTINPVDRPALSVQSVDIQAAVTRALAERTDAMQSRKNLEITKLNLEISKDQTKPNLSLSSGYTLSGQGGAERNRQTGEVIVPGGYLDALRAIGSLDLPTWNFGFNFSYPIGMRAAKANYARALIGLDQAEAQLKVQELTISTEVINAGLNVENTYKLYQAAVKSREAAEKNAEAAQTRFDVGMLTNFEVVTSQNQLTSSRLQELSRLIAYMNAVAEFDRVQRVGR